MLGTIVYSSIGIYIFGHGLWYMRIQRHPLNNVFPFMLLVPIIGVTYSIILLSVALTIPMIGGGILALVGVAALCRPSVVADTGHK